jgi:hypothetical protein
MRIKILRSVNKNKPMMVASTYFKNCNMIF